MSEFMCRTEESEEPEDIAKVSCFPDPSPSHIKQGKMLTNNLCKPQQSSGNFFRELLLAPLLSVR
jgi:hypothetical protein